MSDEPKSSADEPVSEEEARRWLEANKHEFDEVFCGGMSGDVHDWFGLTYASYITWPRSLLQLMPADWQHRFRVLAEELDATFRAPLERGDRYTVNLRHENGRFGYDPLRHYRHGLDPHIEARARDIWGKNDPHD